ncbi:MAG: 5-(carboxyamino)imidazole ribonucleotide synthase [Tuberibacillus sp.]
MKRILPGQTIGILGGGQLGRMMAIAAKQMGFRIAVLDPTPDCPTAQVADVCIVAAYDDIEAAMNLADVSDVITYEFENVDSEMARLLETQAYLPQGGELLRMTQDRLIEKQAIENAGVSVAPYQKVVKIDDLKDAIRCFGFPAVLKTATGGYDGKGQYVLRNERDVAAVEVELTGDQVYVLEKWVDFSKEISVIVTRNTLGETSTFPVAENIHVNNILHQTIVPARIKEAEKQEAVKIALKIAESIQLVGTLAVEMFLQEDGKIFANELAPRPHNSGHYTIEACDTSQFEQHIRAVCGWPLGSTTLLKPVVMVNLLGQHMKPAMENIPNLTSAHYHIYGKSEAKQNRKMGHVTVLGNTVDEALEKAQALGIWEQSETVEAIR